MFIEAGTTAVKLAEVAYDNRQLLLKGLRRLRTWLKRGTLRIAFFGPGGAGKTTLAMFIAGTLDLSTPRSYEESVEKETFKLGDLVAQLLVPPGQHRRRNNPWEELFRRIETGSAKGIINVVSWGYNSFSGFGYKDFPFSKPDMTPEEFLEIFLEQQRAEELAVLEQIRPHLLGAKGKLWMITVVNKQDLWWNDRHRVREHYMRGRYDEIIKDLYERRGDEKFEHEYASVSPIMNNFVSGTHEMLKPTTAGYDQNIQASNSNELIRLIEALARRTTRT